MTDNNTPMPEKPKMGDYKRHLLVCTGPRCTENGEAQVLFETLGEKFKAAGIDKGELRVKRTRTHCFATCKSGPIMCVQPDGIWYYNVNEANLQRIIEEHLVGGRPVEELIYHGSACVAP
ncbi:MAG: NAD(P)H-dependent oxidoreductase subunit E [Methylomonas sp.]|jgi:(2Fe-2S) ferredoxin|uniref:(2Fe-2S) ferredoxin domain-containing protein n=1 Tax=Methylomonas sp. TaxID=418 RepID=UPI0025CBE561|nr:NAD(P)H-dependent oxidoreductase subunit E [Methylomonas sp.]MCK9609213.1 NAD(P)H-dependent oxidoreductase subunit E [Methylomonas sp.]